jgi:stage V sporulation protein SpoVS
VRVSADGKFKGASAVIAARAQAGETVVVSAIGARAIKQAALAVLVAGRAVATQNKTLVLASRFERYQAPPPPAESAAEPAVPVGDDKKAQPARMTLRIRAAAGNPEIFIPGISDAPQAPQAPAAGIEAVVGGGGGGGEAEEAPAAAARAPRPRGRKPGVKKSADRA